MRTRVCSYVRLACVRRTVVGWLVSAAVTGAAGAQAVDDGVVLARRDLVVGAVYVHDSWREYWEGPLKRDNGNIGTLTTQATVWFANYGVTDRLTVLGSVPRVWTKASQGVLSNMEGFQDVSVAVKYRLFENKTTRVGAVRVLAVAATGMPMTDYTPDFQPLSIGLGTRRLSGRGTVSVRFPFGWSASWSSAYTWRSDVTLDRPFYFTDDTMFFTDHVDMPNVFDYIASVGFAVPAVQTSFAFSQQHTLGGGDIRRQDMPFVSNRMNFSRIGAMVNVPVPKMDTLAARFQYGYTVAGRNVGQSTTMTVGLDYRLRFGQGAVQ